MLHTNFYCIGLLVSTWPCVSLSSTGRHSEKQPPSGIVIDGQNVDRGLRQPTGPQDHAIIGKRYSLGQYRRRRLFFPGTPLTSEWSTHYHSEGNVTSIRRVLVSGNKSVPCLLPCPVRPLHVLTLVPPPPPDAACLPHALVVFFRNVLLLVPGGGIVHIRECDMVGRCDNLC